MTVDLAGIIGRGGAGLTLRQGIVVGAPSAGVATIRLGGSTDDIPGVRYLVAAAPADTDVVWVLQTGGLLLIIGVQ